MRLRAIPFLLGSYIVDLIYTLVEWDFGKKYYFFPFFHGYDGWDGSMALGSYVYYYCQHVSLMMIYWGCFLFSGWKFIRVLFWVEFLDLIDYMLCYHEAWLVMIDGFQFDFNYLKLGIIFYYAYNEWKKLRLIGSLSE